MQHAAVHLKAANTSLSPPEAKTPRRGHTPSSLEISVFLSVRLSVCPSYFLQAENKMTGASYPHRLEQNPCFPVFVF